MSNIIDSIQLSGTVYTLSAQTSGGGKAIEAGRGIIISTGATADTVSLGVPISAGTGTNSIIEGDNHNTADGNSSHAEGNRTSASGNYSHAEGDYTKANGMASHAEGYWTTAATNYSHTEGQYTITTNQSEHASGQYNVSNSATTTFGDSGNTLFSVGNGDWSARHNAFEIRQNGDIYLSSGGTDIKLQDHLGGGGSSYTAGDGIDITNNVISVTGKVDTSTYNTFTAATDTALASKADTATTYTKTETDNAITAATSTKQDTLVSGTNIKTINNESILGSGNITIQGGGNPTVELTQAEYDALVTAGTVSADTYYIITDAQAGDLTQYWTSAQTNSAINQAVSRKVDTSTYTAYTAATDTALAGKQTTLTAGTGIDITDNVISATGGGGGGKAIEAGTNISVTTGATADTINCTIPYEGNPAYRLVFGYGVNNKSQYSIVVGVYTNTTSSTQNNIAVGYDCHSKASNNATFGVGNNSLNQGELSAGLYNISNTGSTDADKTLFSVGDGTSTSARHNAFEIRQNGDIYITINGQDVKLQDILLQLSGTTS